MSIVDDVREQLVTELGPIARHVGDLLGADIAEIVESRLEPRCAVLAADLCSDDDRLAAEAVLTLMCLRWPDSTAEPPEWYQTPAGRMVARSIGHHDTDAVTRTVAAAMLGRHPGTVAQWVYRGALERHPDGGITRASVLARIAAQDATEWGPQ